MQLRARLPFCQAGGARRDAQAAAPDGVRRDHGQGGRRRGGGSVMTSISAIPIAAAAKMPLGSSERARLDGRWADLERLRSDHPMMDAIIEEIDGRRIRVGDHWLSDFASCNYLGFDVHPEI